MQLKSSKTKKLSYKIRKRLRENNPLQFSPKHNKPRAVLRFVKNNIFFNLMCRLRKDPFLFATFFWFSTGSKKFSTPQYRGSSKTSYIANYSLGLLVAQKLKMLRLRHRFTIVIKSFGRYLNVFLRALRSKYRFRLNLLDLTPISMNGCRLRRVRRV